MKVLLINPPSGLFRRDDRCQSLVEDQTVQLVLPPLDLAWCAAILRGKGAQCAIEDYPAQHKTWDDFRADIAQGYDWLIISVTTSTIHEDMKACQYAKQVNPRIKTLAFGAYFLIFSKDIMERYEGLDIAVRIEPEAVIDKIVFGSELGSIPGIAYRSGDHIEITDDKGDIKPFDELPLPARDLLNNRLYLSPDTNKPITTIQTSRGCPYECIFCPAGKISGSRVVYRTPLSILKELRECVERFNIKTFLFNADTFTLRRDWLIELCSGIIDWGLQITWATNSRVDTIDMEKLLWMKQAGCHIIGFGIESGDQSSLDAMKKRTTLDDAKRAIKLCRQLGIKSHTFFIIGLPWDTKDTVKSTIDFARELNADFFDINIAFPLPGTEYYDMAVSEGLINGSLDGLSYGSSPVRSRHLSHEELIRLRRKGLLMLYFRPGYITRTLLRELRYPREFINYVRFSFKRSYQLFFKGIVF